MEVDQATRDGWEEALNDFEDIWPTIAKHGLSKDTAAILWFQNLMKNRIDTCLESVYAAIRELNE